MISSLETKVSCFFSPCRVPITSIDDLGFPKYSLIASAKSMILHALVFEQKCLLSWRFLMMIKLNLQSHLKS